MRSLSFILLMLFPTLSPQDTRPAKAQDTTQTSVETSCQQNDSTSPINDQIAEKKPKIVSCTCTLYWRPKQNASRAWEPETMIIIYNQQQENTLPELWKRATAKCKALGEKECPGGEIEGDESRAEGCKCS